MGIYTNRAIHGFRSDVDGYWIRLNNHEDWFQASAEAFELAQWTRDRGYADVVTVDPDPNAEPPTPEIVEVITYNDADWEEG